MNKNEMPNRVGHADPSHIEVVDGEELRHENPLLDSILNPSPVEQKIYDEWARETRALFAPQADTVKPDFKANFSLELRVHELEKENASLRTGIQELRKENSWLKQDVVPALREKIKNLKTEIASLSENGERPQKVEPDIESVEEIAVAPLAPAPMQKQAPARSSENKNIETEDVKEYAAMLAAFLQKHEPMLERAGKKLPPEDLIEDVYKIYEQEADLSKRQGMDSVLLMRISALSYFKEVVYGESKVSISEPESIRNFADYVTSNLGRDFVNMALVVAKSEHAEFIKSKGAPQR